MANKSVFDSIKLLLPTAFKDWVKNLISKPNQQPHSDFQNQQIYYSQEGEDILLSRLLEEKTSTGFYVDIGAHHPTRFSNT